MKILFFMNISTFTLLTWIYHFYYDLTLKKYLNKNCIPSRILVTRNYRLLAHCKKDNYSNNLGLKGELSNYGVNEKKNIYNNNKRYKETNKQSNGSSSKNKVYYKHDNKKKSYIFETKKYSHLEKKIFKELDYIDFLKRNRTISDKTYKKVILKKFRLRLALPLFFVYFLLLSLLLDYIFNCGLVKGLFKVLMCTLGKKWGKPLRSWIMNNNLKWIGVDVVNI
ncbi:fam-l protein [Plasmodium malariae]|uniref:Fam-l protein n=1 Tax=Plasmodium malariae TaxID=5858 RepID=A0A1D3JLX8_PLAMA|nr:fam-l protein [Plasmodium malariae]SBT87664.1 fam-l protein [Plasmodium malariae]